MNYNIHVEAVAALVALLLVLLYHGKGFINLRFNVSFAILCWAITCKNIVGVFNALVNQGTINLGENYQIMVNVMNGLLADVILLLLYLYILSFMYYATLRCRATRIIMGLGVAGMVVAVVVLFFGETAWPNMAPRFHMGIWPWIIGGLYAALTLAVSMLLHKKAIHLAVKTRRALFAINVFILIMFLVQMILQLNFDFVYSSMAYSALLFYLIAQAPDYYRDNLSGLYNRKALLIALRENEAYNKNGYYLVIRIDNYTTLSRLFRYDHMNSLRRKTSKILAKTGKSRNIFRIGSSTWVIDCPSKEAVNEMHQLYMEVLPNQWYIEEEAIPLKYRYYMLNQEGDKSQFNQILQWLHYARSDHKGHHSQDVLVELQAGIMEETDRDREVLHLIEEAILDQRMEIYMQPVYSIKEDKITSLEVLSRMKDKEQNFINPEYFIHVAEKNHKIIELGELIFKRACIFASQNNIFDLGVKYMNINISPGQCRYENLTKRFVEIAEEYNIPMERIHLEITESEFEDSEAVARTLTQFQEAGIKVALDDFGTGCSTVLSILEQPVDYVKIDKSLVWSYSAGENRFLDDLMPLINSEGKLVIAEGIETEEHIDIFKRLGGDFLQGYFFSKPVPEREFVKYVRKFNEEHAV